jgi:putative sterol carrier protein
MAQNARMLLESRVGKLHPVQVTAMKGVYQFHLLNREPSSLGGRFALVVDETNVSVVDGDDERAAVTISMPESDFVAVMDGKLDPMQAFMKGAIQISGAMDQAMKLAPLFGM